MTKGINGFSIIFITLLIAICAIIIVEGCGGGAGQGGGGIGYPGDISYPTYSPTPTQSTSTYTLSGRITDPSFAWPLSGATVSLNTGGREVEGSLYDDHRRDRAFTIIGEAQTDSNGGYIISGVPQGEDYTIIVIHSDYIATYIHNISISSDSVLSYGIPDSSDLDTATHPYDSSKGYALVKAIDSNYLTPISGIAMSVDPGEGIPVGYLTDGNPTIINWSATSTYQNGQALFSYLTPGNSYSISLSGATHTFTGITSIAPLSGALDVYTARGTQ